MSSPNPPESDTSHQPNMSKRRSETVKVSRKQSVTSDDFGNDDIDDDELMKASFADLQFDHIENYANPTDAITRKNTVKNKSNKPKSQAKSTSCVVQDKGQEPVQLANGKWACNHPCKDRIACKHLCCKDGMEKPSKKKPSTKRPLLGDNTPQHTEKEVNKKGQGTQTKLHLAIPKRKSSAVVEELDLTQPEKKTKAAISTINRPKDVRNLHQLHKFIQGEDPPSPLHSVMHTKPAYCYSQGGAHNLSFMGHPTVASSQASSDYGDIQFDDTSTHLIEPSQNATADLVELGGSMNDDDYTDNAGTTQFPSRVSETFDDDDSLLGDAMVGLVDSQNLKDVGDEYGHIADDHEEMEGLADEPSYEDEEFPMDIDLDAIDSHSAPKTMATSAPFYPRKGQAQGLQSLRANEMSKVPALHGCLKPKESMLKGPKFKVLNQPKATPFVSHDKLVTKPTEQENDVLDLLDMSEAQPKSNVVVKEESVPESFKDLEPWLFQEFGDIIELADD
ncbi:ATP-dependent DNA helicase MER3 [Neocucurbitaria cava]|uniref:ATP-dependent DNA helicase MER3 n=1 Tax=Neocucurbitaria cava TaxID=798079 RepID=A0A9W9CM87_9PLEO|nr:ATP-dependent DNA helicase MER3 [Neocucurbitaria cava]